MVAVLSNLYGRISGNEKQPERRTTGGGQSGSRTFSDRNPTPKPIGGPLTNLGKAATSFALFPPLGILGGLGGLFEGGRQVSGDVQEVSGKTQEALRRTIKQGYTSFSRNSGRNSIIEVIKYETK